MVITGIRQIDLLSNEKSTYLGLVDLMFAYSYNYRLTEGENNVESVWCIGKVSPMLSSLEVSILSLLHSFKLTLYKKKKIATQYLKRSHGVIF
jgi:protein SHQ1